MAEKEPTRRKYKLKGGKHTIVNADTRVATKLKTGDTAMLTDAEYEAFKDKFVPVDGGPELEVKDSKSGKSAAEVRNEEAKNSLTEPEKRIPS